MLSKRKEKFSFRHCTEILVQESQRASEIGGIVKRNSCPKRKKNFLLDIVLDFCFENLKGLAKLEGLSKNSCPKRKKNFLLDIVLDFYFENLKGLAKLEGLSKKQLSEKKEKFSFRHCTGFLF